jgi:hypothetical protein
MKRLLYSTAFLAAYVILIMVVEWDLGYYPIMTFIALHLILFLIVNPFLKNSYKKTTKHLTNISKIKQNENDNKDI